MQGLGYPTKTVFLKGIEAHKLHHEFEASAAIKRGQPVVLNADGTVAAAAIDADHKSVIGWSIHTAGVAGDQVTIAMRAMGIVWAMPKAAVDAGPVAYDGLSTADDTFSSFKTPTPANEGRDAIAHALDQATTADELIRVAIL